MTVTCRFCGLIYGHRQSLNKHMKACHPSQRSPANVPTCSLLCTVCKNSYKNNKQFIEHLSEFHDVAVSNVAIDFDSLREFREWKIEMEQNTGASYISPRGTEKNKGTKVLRFKCNRSGYYRTAGQGMRQLKTQGTRKIGGYCPSGVKVIVHKDGKCTVTHFKDHWGHTIQLHHLSLTPEERKRVASKVAAEIPLGDILEEIRQDVRRQNPDEVKRLDLITKKDLYNIKASFNRTPEYMNHKCDPVSVDALVRLMQTEECKAGDSCILLYKPQNQRCDEFPSLSEEDFFLAIFTNAQSKMLESYGHDIVRMDGPHCLNGYGFQLVTLMVVDDMREGFPCAFLFTNRVATETLTVFFSKIKKRLGTKLPSPKVFMADMEDSFYNAWIGSMDVKPGNWLYCTRHVDKAWKKHLEDVETTEKKCQVYKMLRSLMEETDEEAFSKILPLAVKTLLDDPATRVYGQYFETYFAKNPRLWAYCHRRHLGVSAAMYVESMHKYLKYFELDVKPTKWLDKGIFAVMRFLSTTLEEAEPNNELPLTLAEDDDHRFDTDDDPRSPEKNYILAEVCNGEVEPVNNALVKVKEEAFALLKNIHTLIENSMSIDGIETANNLLSSIAPAMAAVRESPEPNVNLILQDNSNKRKIETKLANLLPHKKLKIKRIRQNPDQLKNTI